MPVEGEESSILPLRNSNADGDPPQSSETSLTEKETAPTPARKSNKKVQHNGQSPIPIIEDGKCLKCYDLHADDTKLVCRICKIDFHASCYDLNGKASPEAVCSKSFYGNIQSILNDGRRWGNLCFICNECDSSLDKNSADSASKKLVM